MRRATAGVSSASLVLMKHDLDVGDGPFTFYSLLAHLDLPARGSAEANAIPWLHALAHAEPGVASAFDAGQVVALDARVEAGDTVGYVGTVSRGPEEGPEIHFEIFTTGKLPGELGRAFHYVNASDDGAIVRRADLVTPVDTNGDQTLDAAELERFFQAGNLDRRQAFRRVAIRHRHEWGDRDTEESFVRLRELSGLAETDRRRLYGIAIAPYVFWTDELSSAVGLPVNQTIYSYNALTFLLELSARTNHVALPTVRGREIGETSLESRRLKVTMTDWTNPRRSPTEPPLFGAPMGVRLSPRRREEIPLIELAPTDNQ